MDDVVLNDATATPSGSSRMVLVDLDWTEADVLPGLLECAEFRVGLVAGDGPEDPGVRAAELCGVPRTLELGDLAREIFDLAVVGDRCRRRSQVEGLLRALGTPIESPRAFRRHGALEAGSREPLDQTIHAGASLDEILSEALPDLTRSASAPATESLIGVDPEALLDQVRTALLRLAAGETPDAVLATVRRWLARS